MAITARVFWGTWAFKTVLGAALIAMSIATLNDLQKLHAEGSHGKFLLTTWRACCVFGVVCEVANILVALYFNLKKAFTGAGAGFSFGILMASCFYSSLLMFLVAIVLNSGKYMLTHSNDMLYGANFVISYISAFLFFFLFVMALVFKDQIQGMPVKVPMAGQAQYGASPAMSAGTAGSPNMA